ncbi:MAG: hypothetical protein KQJ78_24750 [Deltaproteobacteria bacterium]|nr:hypothetical protein [Deltaproteobacteria bacterium]
MEATEERSVRPKFSLEPPLVRLLAAAEHHLGQLHLLARLWPAWGPFARGPLLALAAAEESRALGYEVDLRELLALGPHPSPSRPNLGLRWAVGAMLATEVVAAEPRERPLTPSLVNRVHHELDAPFLARGFDPLVADEPPDVPGSAAWTLAARWLDTGLPPLAALGLTLAAWEREGKSNARRGLAGRVLLTGLAPRLGLAAEPFYLMGTALRGVAGRLTGGWAEMERQIRSSGSWKLWLGVFLGAVEAAADRAVQLGVAAWELQHSHQDLIRTWIRAPRHPLALGEVLVGRPVIGAPEVAAQLEVTQRTAGQLVDKLAELGILAEITGQRRGRRFAYEPLVEILEPPSPEESPV